MCSSLPRELNAASDELAQKQAALAQAQSELGTLKDSGAHQRRRATEMIRSLLQDLGEVGAVVAKGRDDLKKPDGEEPFFFLLAFPPCGKFRDVKLCFNSFVIATRQFRLLHIAAATTKSPRVYL